MEQKLYVIIAAAVVLVLMYIVKRRFKNNTRVRYIEIYETDDKYLSYDAFWHRKHLKKRLWKFIAFPTIWSFIPLVPNRTRIKDVVFIAGDMFNKAHIDIKTKKPIKSINRVNHTYHISINAHININKDSRKVSDAVDCDDNSARLEYGKNYIMIFDDNTGYVLKVRDSSRR